MSTSSKAPKLVDIVWTLPEGKELESFWLEYGGEAKTVGEKDQVSEVAFKKMASKGICQKAKP